jgi:glycosyltransferase involved in cell wall biosynthesis
VPECSLPLLAVLCDYHEEGWPSMDLVGDMLLAELAGACRDRIRAERIRPPYRRWFSRVPLLGRSRLARNADRLLNRFRHYPLRLRRCRHEFDLFHVCDHSYAHLVHELPADRTGVFCHDLDTFRCLLEPQRERRSFWFRSMTRRILDGLRKAAIVFHGSREVGRQLLRHGLVDPERLVWAPPGVAPEFTASPEAGNQSEPMPGTEGDPYLLNVGSCIPRKRIDVLLEVFAAIRRHRPDLRLVQIGGDWTSEQRERIARLGIGSALVQLRGLPRSRLAEHYRRAALVVQPSEAEGFGLPLVEGLACGAVVVASDLPVFREVAGAATVFRPVADVPAWSEAILRLLDGTLEPPARALRLETAQRYSWHSHARTVAESYRRLLGSAN